jgi:hypothetical protein
MLNQLLGDARHIRWFPRDYVMVGSKKTDERAFLFITQAASNQSCLDGSPPSSWMVLMLTLLGLGFTLDWLGL